MTDRVEKQGLQVAAELADFIDNQALDGTGIDSATFWKGFAGLISEMTPRNRAALAKRDDIQEKAVSMGWNSSNDKFLDFPLA